MSRSSSFAIPDEKESIATIHPALDIALSFFDTADAYGPYINEELVGRAHCMP
jgi:aryl-alcohol dehydrogenase-like predicted oxidoreductase